MEKTLYRSRTDKMIAGVCGGLAEYFDMDSSVVRLLFVLLTLVGGSSILLYIILAIVIPEEASNNKEEEMPKKAKAEEAKEEKSGESNLSKTQEARVHQGQLLGGIIVIIVGLIFLGDNFLPWLNFGKLWPVILVIVGIWLLIKRERD